MTPAPEIPGPDSEPADAARVMLELGVRHLPNMGGGRLVGVLSMRYASVPTTPTSADGYRAGPAPGGPWLLPPFGGSCGR